MLFSLILGLALLLGGLALARWFAGADPKRLAGTAKTAGIVLLVLIAAGLVVTGRGGWLIALVPFALPWLLRRGWAGPGRGGSSGDGWGPAGGSGVGSDASAVRTAVLDMRLDHHTGILDGDVLQGVHVGRRLSTMAHQELLQVLAGIDPADRKSALLLEAYLDRRYPDWRQTGEGADGSRQQDGSGSGTGQGSGRGGGSSSGAAMSHDEALRILGLAAGADAAAIKAAHLRLIGIVHPDRGGSPFLAAQVNRARDVLLSRGGGG